MSTIRDIELLNKDELSKLSASEIDEYHIKVQNHKDRVHAYMRETLIAELNKRRIASVQGIIETLSDEQKASLAQHLKTNGIESLET